MAGIATATKRKIASVLAAFAVSVAALQIATQYIADVFDNQPALGPALFQIEDILVYPPWAVVAWIGRWGEEYAQPFAAAQLVIFSGVLAALSIVAFGLRTRFASKPFGKHAWASFDDLRAADLFAPIVVPRS